MPRYGSLIYWEKRYTRSDEPFDWMCDYEQLEPTLLPLLHNSYKPNKDVKILIVGCGNANFSSDFVNNSGFNTNSIVHIDYCEVVIQQQKKKFPQLNFRIMDALDMTFDDDEFDFIIDKSLIDTTLCYHDGRKITQTLFNEFHRVLKPNGRIVTISLHTEEEVKEFKSSNEYDYEFIVSSCKIVNKRRSDEDNDIRCLYHTLAVFDKLKNLTIDEKEKKMKWHKKAIFKNALGDDEFLSMVHEMLITEGEIRDENCIISPKDESHHQQDGLDVENLSSKIKETKLNECNTTCA